MEPSHLPGVLERVLLSEEQIQARIAELAAQIAEDYAGRPPLLIGVLKGAVMVMADLSRALPMSVEMDWMAVSSYGSGTTSSGVVRILKDLSRNAGLPSEKALQISGHSLRVGAAQDLMSDGRDLLTIMRAGGWKSMNVVSRYVEKADWRIWD